MRKQIMKRAWEIARKGQSTFGGKVREYFSESLKIAWAEARNGERKMDIDTAESIKVKNENGIVEMNRVGEKWYIKFNGKTTSNFYDHSHVKGMIENGDVYGEVTYA